ncbi:MAG: 30S ribosomal protein S6 [Patescibacteria group bacterium]
MAETSQVNETSSQASPKETRPIYEIGFHVVPTVDEAGAAKAADAIKAAVVKGDAEIISEAAPSRMRLSYTIERATAGAREKYDEAYFGVIKFAIEREHVAGLEQVLRANREILRYLFVQTIREDIVSAPRRVTFASDRLEGETIKKPITEPEKSAEVSEEDLDKTLDALVS